MSVYIITSLLRLLNVVCVTSKPKLIGGAYIYIYMYKHSIFFYNIHDSIIRYIERKKNPVQTCLRWIKKCTDWLLIFMPSYFFLFMYDFSDTKMLVTGFSFCFFFFCVCELNKMLVIDIFFIVENLVWLCWVFFIKWQIPKCLDFYIIIQMCSPSLLCVFYLSMK